MDDRGRRFLLREQEVHRLSERACLPKGGHGRGRARGLAAGRGTAGSRSGRAVCRSFYAAVKNQQAALRGWQ